ncbi:hypothetical protein AB0K04_16015 [Micromonospora coxensis]
MPRLIRRHQPALSRPTERPAPTTVGRPRPERWPETPAQRWRANGGRW